MRDRNEGCSVFLATCVIVLVFGCMVIFPYVQSPEEVIVDDVKDVAGVYIAVHPYFERWIAYNGSLTVIVDGRNETGICLGGWFLTSYVYDRGTDYTVIINGTVVGVDDIGMVGDFATWKGSLWYGYVGSLVDVCHLNLTKVL